MPRPPRPGHRLATSLAVAAAAFVATTACSPREKPAVAPAVDHGHDHDDDHDHPRTLAEGTARLRKLATDIVADLGAGSRDAADDAVHKVGHTLEDFAGLVAEAKLPAQAAEQARQAIDDLEESFGKLDQSLHAAEGQGESPAEVHASVKDRIESALGTLEKIEK